MQFSQFIAPKHPRKAPTEKDMASEILPVYGMFEKQALFKLQILERLQ